MYTKQLTAVIYAGIMDVIKNKLLVKICEK